MKYVNTIVFQMGKSHHNDLANLRAEFSKLETAFVQLKQAGAADFATYAEKLKSLNAK